MAEARITWSSTATAQLIAYTQRLQEESVTAAEKAISFLHERVVTKARYTPGWSSIADEIEVWSQDGQLVVGVRDNEMVSEAFALEYGDEVRPPSPLFRTLNAESRQADDIVREHMESKFGYGGKFGAAESSEG